MNKIKEYKIVVGKEGFKSLEKEVSTLLNEKWNLVAGVAFNAGFSYQAMTREIEVKDEETHKIEAQEVKETTTRKPMDTAEAMRMLENGV